MSEVNKAVYDAKADRSYLETKKGITNIEYDRLTRGGWVSSLPEIEKAIDELIWESRKFECRHDLKYEERRLNLQSKREHLLELIRKEVKDE